MTKTHEEYVQEVYRYWNNEYSILGLYIGALLKIKTRHNVCGTEWDCIAASLIRGHGCPACSNNRTGNASRKTHEQFVKDVFSVWGNEYEIIGEYKRTKTKIKVIHNICRNELEVTPCDFLRGHGCPFCSGNMKRTQEKFLQDVYTIVKEEYSVLGEYINVHSKVEMCHNICGFKWFIEANSFLRGRRCPDCSSSSKGEREIEKFLLCNKISYVKENAFSNCKYEQVLPFDFYLLDYNLCIENDGEQHFFPVDFAGRGDEWAKQEFKELKKRDYIKTKYCKDNNISLLRIPYWDFNRIEEILTDTLL